MLLFEVFIPFQVDQVHLFSAIWIQWYTLSWRRHHKYWPGPPSTRLTIPEPHPPPTTHGRIPIVPCSKCCPRWVVLFFKVKRTASTELLWRLVLRVAASPAPDITIYRPQPDLPGTTQIISASVIGASVFGVDNGLTRYIVSAVQSFEALGNSFSTQTLLTTPVTLTCKCYTVFHSVFLIYFYIHVVTIEENDSIYNALAIQTLTVDGEIVVDNVVVQCTADPFGGDANCIQIETVSGTGLPAGGIATTTRYLAATTPLFTITDGPAIATATTPGGGVVSQITIKPSGSSSSNASPVQTASSGTMQMRAGGVYLSSVLLFMALFFIQWW